MGQQHQVYLIAKVVPHGSTDGKPQYQSLGGFHNQWCLARLPVQATRRFIDLVNQPQNAEIIRYEINAIQGKYNLKSRVKPVLPQIPCPYLMYVLAMAWSFKVEVEEPHYLSGHSVEPNLIGSSRGSWSQCFAANDDGITIIDVSDLSNPAYCHCVIQQPRALSAEEYLKIYYPEAPEGLGDFDRLDLRKTIDSMAGVPLLTWDILSEVWPREYRKGWRPPSQTQTVEAVHSGLTPKLSETSIDVDLAEMFLKFPERADQILVALGRKDELTHAKLSLFTKLLVANPSREVFDLSGWVRNPAELTSLLVNFTKLKSVNLSNTQATIDTIKKMLTANPTISTMNLLGTSISNEEILPLFPQERTL
ncbi:hypothetical protein ONZ45_g16678 [Pleurotus djamor]|nr:hypothetical protein ONZ45_g16678 [Pleurotus djamor]